jgi:hypothetical protein
MEHYGGLSGSDVLFRADGTAPRIEHFISQPSKDVEVGCNGHTRLVPNSLHTQSEIGNSRSRATRIWIFEPRSGC